ncbi:hypothetical protein PAHAL_3G373300 [Panicum hallii]|jgi:hypothetical protein|uniref:Uncharacterized protein n=1 Tax=Panicum hallii TaxID=206008 RepID=A0A2T8KKJ4_9POAL|nr:hypothetical protein PAHAL_3G373300 [Panicum hallii]
MDEHRFLQDRGGRRRAAHTLNGDGAASAREHACPMTAGPRAHSRKTATRSGGRHERPCAATLSSTPATASRCWPAHDISASKRCATQAAAGTAEPSSPAWRALGPANLRGRNAPSPPTRVGRFPRCLVPVSTPFPA